MYEHNIKLALGDCTAKATSQKVALQVIGAKRKIVSANCLSKETKCTKFALANRTQFVDYKEFAYVGNERNMHNQRSEVKCSRTCPTSADKSGTVNIKHFCCAMFKHNMRQMCACVLKFFWCRQQLCNLPRQF